MPSQAKSRPPVRPPQRRGSGWGWIIFPAVAAVIIVGVSVFAGNSGADPLKDVQHVADQGHTHLSAVTEKHDPYNSDPPTSGPHMPYILKWNFYTSPQPPEYLVHNLEDGGVVIYYRPDAPDSVKERLKAMQAARGEFVIVVPGSQDQKEEVILTAWTVMLRQPQFNADQAQAFIARYAGVDHHVGSAG